MQKLIDSRKLLTFSSLARVGSFTRVAKELGLTQSAISHSMKSLERDMGCRLCNRSGRRVCLTQAGEQLLRHADKILSEMDAARLGINAINDWRSARLRIGASASICQYVLPPILSEFKKRYPRCSLSIEPGDFDSQKDLLNRTLIDLAFMLDPSPVRDLGFLPVFSDELIFVVSPAHRWAIQGKVRWSDLSSETVILYNKASRTFAQVHEHFFDAGINVRRFLELSSMEAIKELVKLGMGVGVIAPWVTRVELQDGSLQGFTIGPRPIKRNWGLAYVAHRRLSQEEETFASLCRVQCAQLGLTSFVPAA